MTSTLEPCRTCRHPRHVHLRDDVYPNGRGYCTIKTVSGPAVDSMESVSKKHYEHIGREVTGCGCTEYVTERNGVTA